MNLLRNLNHEGHTIVMVTHSRKNAEYAGRLVEVADGFLRVNPVSLEERPAMACR
jgi:ABC-type lipoprotein export system ATPase subunit